ncbi:tRNA uracil 4-sulfurtransferase ThiI [Hutsoniella sourekii]
MKRIVVHYGELSTKGRNRKMFQEKMAQQIREKTHHLGEKIKVSPQYDFLYITWEHTDYQTIIEILKDIPGISRFSPSYQVSKDLGSIKKEAVRLFSNLELAEGESFKIVAKRSDKDFPYDTYDLQREVGSAVALAYPQLKVQMKQPDHKLTVNIHQGDYAYLDLTSYPGLGGLPYGTSGRGLLMLSGGFDSPIAGYLMIKRGMALDAVHFSSPPYTSPQALEKAKKLAAQLTHYGLEMKFYNVPFARIQEAIKEHIPDSHSMTVMRRMMLRVMDQLLEKSKAQAIVNGESLGQVASQTLDSMAVINEVTSTPILRPLIATDKTEIIELAEKIGTYDLSNEPFEDCCTVFAPTSPSTRPNLEAIIRYEQALAINELVDEAVRETSIEWINESYLEQDSFDDLL